MKDQVLSIEQMNILKSKGVDISKASMVLIFFDENGVSLGWGVTNNGKDKPHYEYYDEDAEIWESANAQYFDRKTGVYDHSSKDECAVFTTDDLMKMLPHEIKINDRVCELVVNKGSISKGWYTCYSESASVLDAEISNCDMSLITALFELSIWVLDNGYELRK